MHFNAHLLTAVLLASFQLVASRPFWRKDQELHYRDMALTVDDILVARFKQGKDRDSLHPQHPPQTTLHERPDAELRQVAAQVLHHAGPRTNTVREDAARGNAARWDTARADAARGDAAMVHLDVDRYGGQRTTPAAGNSPVGSPPRSPLIPPHSPVGSPPRPPNHAKRELMDVIESILERRGWHSDLE
ncbi:hypothetical protein CPB83DRAFT_924970 [Crepidotus variabilis]|uniref:Uncharacterized protein n=1 Tax=Crepidotus variabilis TaxID=179855 RepID=A0A9P6JRS4_9AGAR|nr:hypothetical protein CPB83DRAFT_924970 [Crepidotus variabilis]